MSLFVREDGVDVLGIADGTTSSDSVIDGEGVLLSRGNGNVETDGETIDDSDATTEFDADGVKGAEPEGDSNSITDDDADGDKSTELDGETDGVIEGRADVIGMLDNVADGKVEVEDEACGEMLKVGESPEISMFKP